MAQRNKKCYLCGTRYKYCSTCYQDRLKPSWMNEFHSESCKDIFDICTRFNMDMITKEQAQKELEKCDLSKRENFKSYVQTDLEVIFEDEKPAAKTANKHEVVKIEKK